MLYMHTLLLASPLHLNMKSPPRDPARRALLLMPPLALGAVERNVANISLWNMDSFTMHLQLCFLTRQLVSTTRVLCLRLLEKFLEVACGSRYV